MSAGSVVQIRASGVIKPGSSINSPCTSQSISQISLDQPIKPISLESANDPQSPVTADGLCIMQYDDRCWEIAAVYEKVPFDGCPDHTILDPL